MLQTAIEEQTARTLATALSREEDLRNAYEAALRLAEGLTNPLAWNDLRKAALALKEGRMPPFTAPTSLFPPSRALETELIKKLYGNRPIPDDFNLADEMIKRIRSGGLDLKPAPDSGWYDYQTFALEALAAPDRMPEAKHLALDESYRSELEGLLKALLALTRETHVKQLEMPSVGAAPPPPILVLRVLPQLTLEPLATYYLRRALSYRFVREVLTKAFGTEGMEQMRRLTAAGPVNLSLNTELGVMEALFHGAYLRSCEESGVTPAPNPDLGNPESSNVHKALLSAWLRSFGEDPDLGNDIRTMVPLFYDTARKKIKVWAVLGIATKPLNVSFANRPVVKEIRGPDGKGVNSRKVRVVFDEETHRIGYLVAAEAYVTRLLNRNEFRAHCDRYKTYAAITENLK
jgi:hypothetical protein